MNPPLQPIDHGGDERSGEISDDAQFIVLREGIVGGICAPGVRLEIWIARTSPEDTCDVCVRGYAISGSHISSDAIRSKHYPGGGVHHKRIEKAAFEEVFQKLQQWEFLRLPMEMPRGSEDIYGQDTSLHVYWGGTAWRNEAPNGCVHGHSEIRPSSDEVERFKKAVALVKEIGRSAQQSGCDKPAYESGELVEWIKCFNRVSTLIRCPDFRRQDFEPAAETTGLREIVSLYIADLRHEDKLVRTDAVWNLRWRVQGGIKIDPKSTLAAFTHCVVQSCRS